MSFGPGAYDPDAIESSPGKSGYMTRKDLKVIGIGLVVLALIMTPVYCGMKKQAELHLCTTNFGAISKAINQYAASWDERFPPVYATSEGELPLVDKKGRPSTWATLITPYMSPRSSFKCPSASDDEVVIAQHWSEGSIDVPMTYGMYAPFAGFSMANVYQPGQTALISETSNQGAMQTYDPMPFKDMSGKALPDGFLIAWDNSNSAFNRSTQHVTRLAYLETSNGVFKKLGPSRHEKGINVLFCDGHVELLGPEAASVRHLGQDLTGLWSNGYK